MCKEGAIKGAEKRGARWIIPFDAALPQDDYISVKEFAKRNGISARTTLKMCHSGAIVGAQKSGKAWKIPDAAAAALYTGVVADGTTGRTVRILHRLIAVVTDIDSGAIEMARVLRGIAVTAT